MDPITLAIIGALAKLSESVIADAYQALKAAISRRYGMRSDVVKAMKSVEKKPESAGRLKTLEEEIVVAKVTQDTEILKLAEDLLAKLGQPSGQTVVSQTVTGNKNVFSGTGNVTITKRSRMN